MRRVGNFSTREPERMLVDYHVHTALCGHAVGEMEDYIRAAAQNNLAELGFNDHAPVFHVRDPELTMAAHQLPEYVDQVRILQKKHHRPKIKLGIETDFVPGHEDELRQLLGRYDFDYVYGSVHVIGEWRFDDSRLYPNQFDQRDVDEAYEQYFGLIRQSIRSGLFDVLGHMDLIKKFNYWPTANIDHLLKKTVRAIAEADICVEVNTSGLRRPCAEIYPGEKILGLCHRHGVAVTLGSDAHSPEEVGLDFDKAAETLKRVGYTKVATFERRERKMMPL